MDDILTGLTPAQQEAVEHTDGPLLILAGPGSGKTRVVTHRVARLTQKGVPSRQILALTFTNKAADEMQTRLAPMVPNAGMWVGTFHRFCSRLLRWHADLVGLAENFTIYDSDDSLRTVKRAMQQCGVDPQWTRPQQVVQAISWAKNNLITHERYRPKSSEAVGAVAVQIYPVYQRELLASNAVDFDDLLLHVACLLRENAELRSELDARYRYILVDEYQDTNLAQYTIVRALSNDFPNLAVTGDPDQSIYGWRGANLRNILEFERDFPAVRVVQLEQNYRSTPNILSVADALIAHNLQRKQKALFSAKETGRPVRLVNYATQKEEAESIAAGIVDQINQGRRPRDIGVFYRNNALSRPIEEALRLYRVPYQIVSGIEFYQRKEIRDILAYLAIVNNPRDNTALLRVVNTPPRGIGRKTVSRLQQYAQDHGGGLLEAARRAGLIPSLGKRAALALARFVSAYDEIGELAFGPVEHIIGHVLDATGYRQQLQRSEAEEDQQRLANIEELLTVAREFDMRAGSDANLEDFLEQTSLVNDTDDWETEMDRVSLMTLHAAKGLEFPVVYIIALEQGLLPHERAKDNPGEMEEERRLLFVGITRAEEELQLSYAQHRSYRGREGRSIPSPFTMELPRAEMQVVVTTLTTHHARTADETGDFAEPVWREDEFVQDAPPEAAPPSNNLRLHVKTAADMVQKDTVQKDTVQKDTVQEDGLSVTSYAENSHHSLRAGMAVRHPDYGLGKIVQLTGRGRKCVATVNFVVVGQKTFRLAKAPLQPVTPAG